MSNHHFVVLSRFGIPLLFCQEEIKARGKAEYFNGTYRRLEGAMPVDAGQASAEYLAHTLNERLELRSYAETLPQDDRDLVHQLLDDSVDELDDEPTRREFVRVGQA
jgi:hypothetical protein